jgi:hypothetical protein
VLSEEKRKSDKPVQWGSLVVETIPGQAMFFWDKKRKKRKKEEKKSC